MQGFPCRGHNHLILLVLRRMDSLLSLAQRKKQRDIHPLQTSPYWEA